MSSQDLSTPSIPPSETGSHAQPGLEPCPAKRSAGVLLHPTSLPGPFGIGDLGPSAITFLDWAEQAGQTIWQILPLGPTGHHNSPYSSLSSFAGNPLLLSIDRLREEGWLSDEDLGAPLPFREDRIDFARLIPWKRALLRRSWERFRRHHTPSTRHEMEAFREDPSRTDWLEDWTLFSALKSQARNRSWTSWSREMRARHPEAMKSARERHRETMEYHRYLQFQFHRQWQSVKLEANRRGILVMGDVPIYVAADSADVWANARLFELRDDGHPSKMAGVPPDYFSETGQLWGNPLYRWETMKEEGYTWWISRIRENLRYADLLRLDHFRAFASYWEVDGAERSAKAGQWRPGPGLSLFRALESALGRLPLVAEDLGHITPDVTELLASTGLPGMKVLQFAFDSPDSDHHPERIAPGTVVYTGTHDNDTVRGWFNSLPHEKKQNVLQALKADRSEIHWAFIRAAYGSAARTAIVPLQDILGLGADSRMNDPRHAAGNWVWRARASDLRPEIAAQLREIAERSARLPSPVRA